MMSAAPAMMNRLVDQQLTLARVYLRHPLSMTLISKEIDLYIDFITHFAVKFYVMKMEIVRKLRWQI